MRNLRKQIFRCSAPVLLLGALALAQTSGVQFATDPVRPGVTPVASAPTATTVQTPGAQSGTQIGSPSRPAPPPGSADHTGGPAQAGSPNAPALAPVSAVPNPEMLIGPGDLLEVSVFGAPDYLKQVRVSRDGEVTLPLAGVVKVGGMTIAQAEAAIAKKLADGGYFNDPKVSVLEREFATQGISVLGEVQKPGIYPMPGTRNLYDAISAAGGTTPRAGTVVTLTHRNDLQHPQTLVISYDGRNTEKSNIPIYPGDTVMVSKAGVVYVTGNVRMPGGFVMENAKMTVLQAIALAQGTSPNAKLDSTVLIRTDGQGAKPQQIPLPLKKILTAKSPDVQLRANDIIFVPDSIAQSATKRSLEAIMQVATGIAVFGRP